MKVTCAPNRWWIRTRTNRETAIAFRSLGLLMLFCVRPVIADGSSDAITLSKAKALFQSAQSVIDALQSGRIVGKIDFSSYSAAIAATRPETEGWLKEVSQVRAIWSDGRVRQDQITEIPSADGTRMQRLSSLLGKNRVFRFVVDEGSDSASLTIDRRSSWDPRFSMLPEHFLSLDRFGPMVWFRELAIPDMEVALDESEGQITVAFETDKPTTRLPNLKNFECRYVFMPFDDVFVIKSISYRQVETTDGEESVFEMYYEADWERNDDGILVPKKVIHGRTSTLDGHIQGRTTIIHELSDFRLEPVPDEEFQVEKLLGDFTGKVLIYDTILGLHYEEMLTAGHSESLSETVKAILSQHKQEIATTRTVNNSAAVPHVKERHFDPEVSNLPGASTSIGTGVEWHHRKARMYWILAGVVVLILVGGGLSLHHRRNRTTAGSG